MDPRELFVDERLLNQCVYCGDDPETRDHVPSKVFLDTPYPDNLPVVGACNKCNNGFSRDEAYMASIIECIIANTTMIDFIKRAKIKNILKENSLLHKKIIDEQNNNWNIDVSRFNNILLKLAQGHVAYELQSPQFDIPYHLSFIDISSMASEDYAAFNDVSGLMGHMFPEIGSRAFNKMVKNQNYGWQEVQPQLYRYVVLQDPSGIYVRMVLREFLACEVIWE